MAVLYVVEQGAQVGKSGGSLEVRHEGRALTRVPMHLVSQIVLFGGVQMTAAAVSAVLDAGIEVAYLTMHGRYKGRIQPAQGKNIVLRRAQFRRADDEAFCVELARAIARGKLSNQHAACLRWARQRGVEEHLADGIDRQLRALTGATDRAQIMGIEGAAGRGYYAAMREALREDLEFPRRTRRPPTDPVSLLLSLSSALLQTRVHAALCLVGFDPYLGFFHADKYGRPALVLDMMEEFRPLIADAAAVGALNLRVIGLADFAEEEGVLLLQEHAVEDFVRHFDRRVRDSIAHPALEQQRDYAGWIEFQARVLAQVVLGELPEYVPFTPAH